MIMRWPARILRVLLIILAMGLGLSLPVAQACDMRASAALAAAPDMPDANGCPDMPGMDTAACAAMCPSFAAVLPVQLAVDSPHVLQSFESASVLPPGRASPPDPFPPKSFLL